VLSGAIQAPHYREQKAADHESSHDYGRVDVVETKHLLSDRQTKRPTVQITVGRQENPAHCLGQEAMRAGTISRRCARRQYDRTRCRFTSYLANLVRPIAVNPHPNRALWKGCRLAATGISHRRRLTGPEIR